MHQDEAIRDDVTSVAGAQPAGGDPRRAELAAKTLQAVGGVTMCPGPLLAVLAAPGDDPDKVSAAIEASPVLAARLLSVTNSAGVGLSREIQSVRRAVIHLGGPRARTIALAYGLRLLTADTGLAPEIAQALWVCSLRKAAAARLAAEAIDPKRADEAYALGLLQDIGLPLLVALDPAFYYHEMAPGTDRGTWCEQEQHRFGLDHAAVGSRLLQEWNCASKLCDAVGDHHRLTLADAASIERVPWFLASLLPHLVEPQTPTEHEWTIALHAQFLASRYPSPDAFTAAANKAAAGIHRSASAAGGDKLSAMQMRQVVHAIAADTETMVTQLCQLEHAVGRQREHLSQLRFQAFTDPLTKVLNRRGFEGLAQRRLEAAATRGVGVCMVVIDLDDFKQVNDGWGHEAGDLVLRGLAKVLRRSLQRSDLIGRLGGDEFAVMLMGLDEPEAQRVIERLTRTCNGTAVTVAPDQHASIRVSVGAAFCNASERPKVENLVAAADEAMYERKRNGKSGFCFSAFEA